MGYFVDRVVICDAYKEPDKHYRLLPGGRATLLEGRRPSMRFLASAKKAETGITGILGKQASLFQDMAAPYEQLNEFVNELRGEIREWRRAGYPGTALVTRRLLEWWFERDEERKAQGKRFFFCQQEAVETVIYLYEVKNRQKMPETGDFVRYAIKMATGTGKTLLMALLITWSALHKRKVSNSSLSENFLVMVPNLTVRDRVSGFPRGDGLDSTGAANLYEVFETVPPEYLQDFNPNVIVKNWQAMSATSSPDDWIGDDFEEEGRFVPASVLWAIQRRRRRDPEAGIRQLIQNWHDLFIINDEAHHVYGEKRVSKGEEPDYVMWNAILNRISRVARVCLVVDTSATPWYGSGSPKPDGTLFEWLVSDFSVYDAFESGLIKVVRLPEEKERGRIYLDLWDDVKGAKTKEEYLSACKGAIEHIYSAWKEEYQSWLSELAFARGPSPVVLIVASDSTRAKWIFEHVTRDYTVLKNPSQDDPIKWVTIQVDSGVFDAERGKEAILRKMVNTVGSSGQPGEGVRCIVCVNMLSEGWDVKSVTHILGLRAFVSPLLTEQIIGRGLRRTNYGVLNQPLAERSGESDETVDAFGIPFVGFPVERRKRPRTGEWGQKPVTIVVTEGKGAYRTMVPNVRSWAAGITQPLSEVIKVQQLPELIIRPNETPPEVTVRPVVGNQPQQIMTLEEFRKEYPLLRSFFLLANELVDRTNPSNENDLAVGPTFEELVEVVQEYFQKRVSAQTPSDLRDIGIWYWRKRALDILETGIRGASGNGVRGIPILGAPEVLDTTFLHQFQWTGVSYKGKKTHTNLVPCHTQLEADFASFLDSAKDVMRYIKNEKFGFSITYYQNSRPRQYYPDFIVVQRGHDGHEIFWLSETKGEIRPDTFLKSEAAGIWCGKMSGHTYGEWRHLLVPQESFERAVNVGVDTFEVLARRLRAVTATLSPMKK